MKKINWGIIGCGDVTEVKSGPAFNRVPNSSLVAVMRRDAAKAQDYARRHGVPNWYDNASSLINDPEVNAIYIATPPSSHEEYAMAAIEAGKPVYVEKPMSLTAVSAFNMNRYASERQVKLVVAHYRRAQPLFQKVLGLLNDSIIGEPRLVNINYFKRPLTLEELQQAKTAWRVDPAVSGGGLFHDLAPHQLDLLCYFFGTVEKATGIATCQAGNNGVADLVAGNILFKNGVACSGAWCFNAPPMEEKDSFEIIGARGKISFSIFEMKPVIVTIGGKQEIYSFDALQHVQQPMIDKVVAYFLDNGPNPCSGGEGVEVMKLLEALTTG